MRVLLVEAVIRVWRSQLNESDSLQKKKTPDLTRPSPNVSILSQPTRRLSESVACSENRGGWGMRLGLAGGVVQSCVRTLAMLAMDDLCRSSSR